MTRNVSRIVIGIAAAFGGIGLLSWWDNRSKREPLPEISTLIQIPDAPTTSERLEDGSLRIRWKKNASAEVYVGTSFAELKLSQPSATVAEGQSVTIADVAPNTRYYYAIKFADGETIQGAERVIPLENLVNFRDLGGYETVDGRRVRWDRVYRAAGLDRLTEEDHAILNQMGINLVCDLRTESEVEADPDNLPAGMRYLHLPTITSDNRWLLLLKLIIDPKHIRQMLPDTYTRVLVDQNAQLFGEIFRRLAQPEELPTLIHCTAGKDRTGIASALLLSMLGVPGETIIADYTISNHWFSFFEEATRKLMQQFQILGISEDQIGYVLLAQESTMRYTLDYIKEHYGSVEDYLRDAAGVDQSVLDAVRANLLE